MLQGVTDSVQNPPECLLRFRHWMLCLQLLPLQIRCFRIRFRPLPQISRFGILFCPLPQISCPGIRPHQIKRSAAYAPAANSAPVALTVFPVTVRRPGRGKGNQHTAHYLPADRLQNPGRKPLPKQAGNLRQCLGCLRRK